MKSVIGVHPEVDCEPAMKLSSPVQDSLYFYENVVFVVSTS